MPLMTRLTETALRGALQRQKGSQREMQDGAVPGLFVRLGHGVATWSMRIRVSGEAGISGRGLKLKGRKYRLTLGTYPELSIERARARANELLAEAREGRNPIADMERSATAGGVTVEVLAKKFLDEYVASRKLRAARKYEQAVATHIVPNLGDVLVAVLTREHVRNLLKKVRVRVPRPEHSRGRPRGGDEAARTALAVLRQMLTWGIREEIVKRADNPASDMERNLPKKRKRDRVLSVEEARLVWKAAGAAGYAFGTHVQLMLLTGCRAGEWSRAIWQWVDLKQGLLIIPAESYKSDHVHVIPLVEEACRSLSRFRRAIRLSTCSRPAAARFPSRESPSSTRRVHLQPLRYVKEMRSCLEKWAGELTR